MDIETAKILCKINNDFYRVHGASFSETRKAPWPGWSTCLELIKDAYLGDKQGVSGSDCREFSVFDLACGNLRFEAFLACALFEAAVTFYAVDNCDGMVPRMPAVRYQSLDILDVLQKGACLGDHLAAPACDLSISFGFMHHVPSQRYRQETLASLVGQTRPNGYVMVSFWQFLNDAAMREKAQAAHGRALEERGFRGLGLDENDCLLGWKNIPGAYRYCHSFSEAEIDQLAESVADKAAIAARFTADGRTGDLNTYLVLRVQ